MRGGPLLPLCAVSGPVLFLQQVFEKGIEVFFHALHEVAVDDERVVVDEIEVSHSLAVFVDKDDRIRFQDVQVVQRIAECGDGFLRMGWTAS